MVCRYVLDGSGVLGQGAYGKVYRVTDTQSGNMYALKTSNKDVCASTLISAAESDIHMRIQHPYLINGVDVVRPSDVDTCGAPIEAVKQGVLIPLMDYDLDKIRTDDKDNPKYPTFNALRASWQLACALEALYAAGYTHFDIKTENVLQKGNDTYLADYGLSYSTATPLLYENLITLHFRPPYVLNGTAPLKQENYMSADLYSLGLVFLDITSRFNFRTANWNSYSENEYVRILAKEANAEVDRLIAFINDNKTFPGMLEMRQKRWSLPLPSFDAMLEYWDIVKTMISPVPTALTATQVRLRLEALWPDHPPAPVLRILPNPPVYEPLRAAATIVTSYITRRYAPDIPRLVPHVVELFLAVSTFATPEGHIEKGLEGHKSWRLPFLYACHNIVATFYSCRPHILPLYNPNIPYEDSNSVLYDDSTTVQADINPVKTVCRALKQIVYSKQLKGRYNFVLPGEPTEFVLVPPGSAAPAPAPAPVRPARGVTTSSEASPSVTPRVSARRSTRTCPPGYVLNPATGRCVLATGRLGSKIMKQSTESPD